MLSSPYTSSSEEEDDDYVAYPETDMWVFMMENSNLLLWAFMVSTPLSLLLFGLLLRGAYLASDILLWFLIAYGAIVAATAVKLYRNYKLSSQTKVD